MKSAHWILLLLFVAGSVQSVPAQKSPDVRFGVVRPEDFAVNDIRFDSGANAIVIADIGSTRFEGNAHGFFNMIYTRLLRVKILNKNGFDIGDQRLMLYRDHDSKEEIKEIKGITYNLENGSVTRQNLEPASVYTDKETGHYESKKFAMPGLKEGSVFDLTYTITSTMFSELRQWEFQGNYPKLWSEYTVTIPPVLHYVSQTLGNPHFDIDETKSAFQKFSIRQTKETGSDEVFTVTGNSIVRRWAMKDVPATHSETYLTTTSNFSAAVRFQLHYLQWNEENPKHEFMSDWTMASQKLLDWDDFGRALSADNFWMNSALAGITGKGLTDEQKMRAIFSFVRSAFTCNSYSGFTASNTLKEVFRKKSGTSAEINLLLIALLRHENIDADPVLLSTRDNGLAEQSYPMIAQFNYVICNARIGPRNFHLDASRSCIGFGKLASDCYNGQGRMISPTRPDLVDLFPDSVTEASVTSIFINNDDKFFLAGTCEQKPGDAKSFSIREEIKRTSEKDYFKQIRQGLQGMGDVTETEIDSLTQYEMPLTVKYEFNIKKEGEADLLYFNPIIAERYASNPFPAANRRYPVEMPYCVDDTYLLNMEIPAGYVADEVPQSARIMLNGNDGFFEYLIQKDQQRIQMRVRLKLKKATFDVDDYNTLRDFYASVVKKESEQIVFKKVK